MVKVLGARVDAPTTYSPTILEPIYRAEARSALAITDKVCGYDCWHLYELSWLDATDRPQHYIGVLTIDCSSPATVESKSLKLYLNSLNFQVFSSRDTAEQTICRDLSQVVGREVDLQLLPPDGLAAITREPAGILLDTDDAGGRRETTAGRPTNGDETLLSHRLRSLCPVTGQPDWGTVVVAYRGPSIDRAALLRQIEGFREHQDFHEHCVESLFAHVLDTYNPERLAITAYYQRRGGIDITPSRANYPIAPALTRMGRQ